MGGYAAALLLDGWALLDRPDLRAGEEALRRWLSAAALVRPASGGGKVVIVADSGRRPVQGLLRWDPWRASARELADRQAVHLPPAVRLAEVTGTLAVGRGPARGRPPAQRRRRARPAAGPGATATHRPRVRALIRAPLRDGNALAEALRAAQGVRTARKAPDPVRVRIDPADLD